MNAMNFLRNAFAGRKLAYRWFHLAVFDCAWPRSCCTALIAPFDPLEIDPVGRLARTWLAKPFWHRSLRPRHVLAGDLRRAHDCDHRRGQRDRRTCCGWRDWYAVRVFHKRLGIS